MGEAEQQNSTCETNPQASVKETEPSIHIAIDSKGNIILESVGTKGKQCDLLTGALEASLGKVTDRVNKDCYQEESPAETVAT